MGASVSMVLSFRDMYDGKPEPSLSPPSMAFEECGRRGSKCGGTRNGDALGRDGRPLSTGLETPDLNQSPEPDITEAVWRGSNGLECSGTWESSS